VFSIYTRDKKYRISMIIIADKTTVLSLFRIYMFVFL